MWVYILFTFMLLFSCSGGHEIARVDEFSPNDTVAGISLDFSEKKGADFHFPENMDAKDSAYMSFMKHMEDFSAQEMSEMKQNYELAIKEFEINGLRQRQVIWILAIVLSSIIAVLSIMLYIRNASRLKEKERNQKVINKLLISTCGVSSSYKKIMEHPASSQDGKQSYNDYKKSLKQIDSSLKKNISNIINEDLPYTPSLSDQERAVLFLLQEGFERKEIALILNISTDSVRTVISNINCKSRKS